MRTLLLIAGVVMVIALSSLVPWDGSEEIAYRSECATEEGNTCGESMFALRRAYRKAG